MRNNRLILFLFLILLTFSLSAQQQKKKQTSRQTAAQKELQNLRFDPKKPAIDMSYVSDVMDNKIQKQLLQKKIPEKVEEMNLDSNMLTTQSMSRYLFPYMVMMAHPDLEVVSRAYAELLNGFKPIAKEFSLAFQQKDQNRYVVAAEAFKKQQAACLAFLKKKQPKIGSEQLIKIRNANTRRRRAEYNARIKKEREEQLKKLQEEKSQKNTNK